ncbi:MAG: RluA family pseudouridine synthase [Rhodothermales bacterium]
MADSEEKQETLVVFDVPPGYTAEQRLDVYITDKLANASRSKVQRGIKDGHVTVNGAVQTKVSTPVVAGDHIECVLQRPPPIEARPEAIPLDIVYEDDVLLVVNKQADLVVHPAYGNRTGTLVNALLHHVGGGLLSFEEEDEEPEDEDVGLSTSTAAPRYDGDVTVRPGIVHRLDKDTTGLMVVAKNDVAHAHLARQFMDRTIRRRYLALVWGVPDPPEGTVETFLGRDPRNRRKMAVVPEERGKHAVTHFETVETQQYTSLLRFRLETGRTHQIRVHARHLGHPILGDPTYDGQTIRYGHDTGKRRAFFRNLYEVMPRQALHAATLGFVHPATGEALDFEAPLPDDMQHVLDRLRRVEGAERP